MPPSNLAPHVARACSDLGTFLGLPAVPITVVWDSWVKGDSFLARPPVERSTIVSAIATYNGLQDVRLLAHPFSDPP